MTPDVIRGHSANRVRERRLFNFSLHSPSPGACRADLSPQGRGFGVWAPPEFPSPLVGEGNTPLPKKTV